NMVLSGIKLIVRSSITGIQSFFGNLLAKNKVVELNKHFSRIEWQIHSLVTFLFGMTIVLLSSFIQIYTKGITDANYDVPLFAFIFIMSQAVYSYRLPYNAIILAGGH